MKKIAPLVTIILIAIPLVMLASACQANTPSTQHAVYLFNNLSGPDHQTYHPGDQWTLNFKRRRSQDSSETTPTQITLMAQLMGPFSSPPLRMGGPVVVSMQPIKTNDWTTLSYTRVFQLPKSLAPGYYNFVQTVSYQSSNGANSTFSGASIIHIVSV